MEYLITIAIFFLMEMILFYYYCQNGKEQFFNDVKVINALRRRVIKFDVSLIVSTC